MKKAAYLVLILFSLHLCGCWSMPNKVRQSEIYSFTKHERKVSAGFSKRKDIFVKDFRGREAYEENIEDLQKEVEKYIAQHPGLSDGAKDNLRKLKVTEGSAKGEVELLLGKPDKASAVLKPNPYSADELWIYRISKLDAVMFFILPFFALHEGHYLYFKADTLAGIEKHFLKQAVETQPGPGMYEKKGIGAAGEEDEKEEDKKEGFF